MRSISPAQAVAVDLTGLVYVTGYTGSANYPTQSPFDAVAPTSYKCFVTCLSANSNSFVYSSFAGSDGSSVNCWVRRALLAAR